MSQTGDQKRFTVSEVAADWHDLMIVPATDITSHTCHKSDVHNDAE